MLKELLDGDIGSSAGKKNGVLYWNVKYGETDYIIEKVDVGEEYDDKDVIEQETIGEEVWLLKPVEKKKRGRKKK